MTTRYSIQKVVSALELLREFQSFAFPHPDSGDAICALTNILEEIRQALGDTNGGLSEDTRAEATLVVSEVLELIGVIANSANVRNAFEVHGPILRLARQLLVDDQTKLILSFEWKYVPYTYPKSHPFLANFVIIGLPASEASNALVLPAVGHELGHSLWHAKLLEKEFTPKINAIVPDEIKTTYRPEYVQLFGEEPIDKADELTNQHVWEQPVELAKVQLEEVFCDFVGLYLFGKCYLDSFEYLISPTLSPERDPKYPGARQRAAFMTRNAAKFDVPPYADFEQRFSLQLSPFEPGGIAECELMIADKVTDLLADAVAERVIALCRDAGLNTPRSGEAGAICKDFLNSVPAENATCLGTILNAGWLTYNDPAFMAGKQESERLRFINDLIFKTIEISELKSMKARPSPTSNVPKAK